MGGIQIDTTSSRGSSAFVIAVPQQDLFCAQQSKGVTIDLDKDSLTPLNLFLSGRVG